VIKIFVILIDRLSNQFDQPV